MSFAGLLIHTVSIVNPALTGGTSIYGDPEEGSTAPVVEAARVEGLTSEENLINRDFRRTTYRIFLRTTTVLTALSTVTWNGVKYRVVGDPITMDDRFGPHHVEAILEGIAG